MSNYGPISLSPIPITYYVTKLFPGKVITGLQEDKYIGAYKYGTDSELTVYLAPQCTVSGESALQIIANGGVAYGVTALGQPYRIFLSDQFNYLSLKEVIREGTGTSGITMQSNPLIVRCMGETTE
jgi:hypothetical protein